MFSARAINRLTWHFEVAREQFKFVRYDFKYFSSIPVFKDDPLFMMALKRFNVAASIFDVGTVNYRKTLKLGQINETSLGRIFSLYIKRARFNVGLSRNDIAELVKTIRNPDKPLLNFMKKINTLNRMLADMSLTFTKAATGDLSSPGLE